jgi:hypothetical protein
VVIVGVDAVGAVPVPEGTHPVRVTLVHQTERVDGKSEEGWKTDLPTLFRSCHCIVAFDRGVLQWLHCPISVRPLPVCPVVDWHVEQLVQ